MLSGRLRRGVVVLVAIAVASFAQSANSQTPLLVTPFQKYKVKVGDVKAYIYTEANGSADQLLISIPADSGGSSFNYSLRVGLIVTYRITSVNGSELDWAQNGFDGVMATIEVDERISPETLEVPVVPTSEDRVAWERYVQSINHPNTFLEGNSLTVASISQSTGQTHLSHTTIDIATGWILNYEDRYSSSDTFYHISFEQVIESDIFSLLNVSGIPDGIGLVAVILVSLLGGAALAKALRWSQHRKGSIQQKQ